jgi:hypothetical protein
MILVLRRKKKKKKKIDKKKKKKIVFVNILSFDISGENDLTRFHSK